MKFNSESGKEAGKISKRGAALGVSFRGSLHELVDKILSSNKRYLIKHGFY